MGVYSQATAYFNRVAPSRFVAAGLTSNVDLLVKWNGDVLQGWVDRYATGPRDLTNIESMADLCDMLLYRLPEGGTECFLCEEAARAIEESLELKSYGVGGTGAQAACALGSLGVRSIVHLTSSGPQYEALLNYPALSIFDNGGAVPVKEYLKGKAGRYAPHFILQFDKGASLTFQNRTYRAPVANKIILSWDELNAVVPVDPGFFRFAAEQKATSLLLSGVSGIQKKELLTQRLQELSALLDGVSRETMVLCECGPFFLEGGCREYLKALGSKSGLISCSDEELFDMMGVSHSAHGKKLARLIELIQKFLEEYRPRYGVVVHTRDVSMYCGKPLPEGRDIRAALAMGNLVASAKARFSNYGTRETVLSLAGEPESGLGLDWAEQLEQNGIAAVPTKVVEHPACTIGLGDSFAAGFLSCM